MKVAADTANPEAHHIRSNKISRKALMQMQGKLFIVMELATEGTLHDVLSQHKGPLPEDTVWRLLIQLLLGLHHIHNKRILHRDIKSLNVFLSSDMHVKIGDMGVSRVS